MIYINIQYLRGFLPRYSNSLKEVMLVTIFSITAKIRNENKIESITNEGDAVILFMGIKPQNIMKKTDISSIVNILRSHQSPLEIIPLPIIRPISITGR